MRRRRPLPCLPTIFTVAVVGVVAAPIAADAAPADDITVPADDADAPDEPPPPTPAPTPETTVPPTTPPETTAPPPPVTTAPDPEPPTTPPDDTVPPETTPPPTQPPVTPPPPAPAPPDAPDAPDVDPPAPTVPTPEPAKPLPDGPLRTIAFPVLGTVQYSNDWGHCRAGCARRHEGTDLIGVRMQPLLAAVDGTVTRIRYENEGTAGSVISITGADGWYYNYFHLNNDTPGTDDGGARPEWQVPPSLTVGSPVRAGQVIGYMGDSGNAEGSVPHLHFEIRTPDRTPVNPYHSLVAAQRRETCASLDAARPLAENAAALSPDAVAIIPIDGGGRWLIDRGGRLVADGPASYVQPIAGVVCAPAEALVKPVAPEATDHQPVPAQPPVDTPPADMQAPAEAQPPAVMQRDETPPPAELPQPAETQKPAADVTPASPAVPTAEQWTVAPDQSLWHIVQHAYGTSDVAATVSLIDTVFDLNRDQLWHPDELEIGMTLQLPTA